MHLLYEHCIDMNQVCHEENLPDDILFDLKQI